MVLGGNGDSSSENLNEDRQSADEGNAAENETINDDKSASISSSDLKHDGNQGDSGSPPRKSLRSSRIRDMLIFREINNDSLPSILPPTCKLIFEDPSELHIFIIKVAPCEGYWIGGTFFFDVVVPDEYNFEPPKVKCTTKIWHPNITEDGTVCLSILRAHAIDETGWNPTRQLKDVDLVNFHDPLNNEASEMFSRDPQNFQAKVKAYIREYAQDNSS